MTLAQHPALFPADCATKGEWASGNIYIRPTTLRAGQTIRGHRHNFDHTTIVFSGAVRVTIEDADEQVVKEFRAPAHFLVVKGWRHTIHALEDAVIWCVYAHRNPQGDVVQEYTGWEPAHWSAPQ